MVVLGLLVVVGWLWAVVFGWQWLLLDGCGQLFLVGRVSGSICGIFIVVDILFYCDIHIILLY